ncbi:hypothetical protein, partial [Microbacterium sp. Bi128]|uniref:hypothetical protein n=1 Tax=Microbacterium sp. Bi128 TaxID=2821115 RepID=UPI001E29729A
MVSSLPFLQRYQELKRNSPAASAAGLFPILFSAARRLADQGQSIRSASNYLMILVTRPEPTVRPPSRIAKPRP